MTDICTLNKICISRIDMFSASHNITLLYRFVKLVRSKTPKITMYTQKAKCMLMENGPTADFETVFYDGRLKVWNIYIYIYIYSTFIYNQNIKTLIEYICMKYKAWCNIYILIESSTGIVFYPIYLLYIYIYIDLHFPASFRGCRGCHCMVVGFTTIGAYHY